MQGSESSSITISTKWLPPGFRFHPTDEELITFFLARKIADGSFTDEAITELDLNQHEPWELPGKAKMMGDKVWYFFSVKDKKYPLGCRTNRATGSGYWKATGKDKEIFMPKSSRATSRRPQVHDQYIAPATIAGNTLVGMKKTLVFYEGRAPKGLKSNWIMHEYRLHEHAHVVSMSNMHQLRSKFSSKEQTWVLCRVFLKKKLPSSTSRHSPLPEMFNHSCYNEHNNPKLSSNDLLSDVETSNNVVDCDWLPPLNEHTEPEQDCTNDVSKPYAKLGGGSFLAKKPPTIEMAALSNAAEAKVVSSTIATPRDSDQNGHFHCDHHYKNKYVDFADMNQKVLCPSYEYSSSTTSNVMEDTFQCDTGACYTSLPRFPSELESLWLPSTSSFYA